MAQPVLMPKLGQTVEESTIVRWHKKQGDKVAKGDVIFEIETDKAVLECESFVEGTLLKIVVPEGQTVPVQSTVAFVGEPGEKVPDVVIPPKPAAAEKPVSAPAASTPSSQPASAPAPTASAQAQSLPAIPVPGALAPAQPGRLKISPRARALAKAKVIDLSGITGSGPGGRIVEKDVIAYLDAQGYDKLRVSPAAKKLASKEGIDVLSVIGSGDSGKVLIADIERAVAEKPEPMSKMRRVIAERLSQSFCLTPHIFVTASVDMTDLLEFRKGLKAKGVPYTVTDFIMMAVTMSLLEHRQFNSVTDGNAVRWNSNVNLGLAVSLENGLVVPVIRNADDMDLMELHDAAAGLAAKAREGKLTPDEMQGGSFTISNMGMMDVENFCAIINPGESAILAISSTIQKPVVRDGKIVPRAMMKITVSADHRINDGAAAAVFVNTIKNKLEDIKLWKSLI